MKNLHSVEAAQTLLGTENTDIVVCVSQKILAICDNDELGEIQKVTSAVDVVADSLEQHEEMLEEFGSTFRLGDGSEPDIAAEGLYNACVRAVSVVVEPSKFCSNLISSLYRFGFHLGGWQKFVEQCDEQQLNASEETPATVVCVSFASEA